MLMHAVDSYLAVWRAVGYDLRDREGFLRSFARFSAERGETHIHAETAIEWARLGSSPPQWDRRIKEIIRFARHVHAENPRHEIPPQGVFGHHPRPHRTPFIWSPTDLRRLSEEALRLPPPGSIRPHTYAALFSLLAATGLRISEAMALQLDDVGPDGLLVRQTKFRKSRLVPLHETVTAGLERYLEHRRHIGGDGDHLFLTERGRPLRYQTVFAVFNRIRRTLDLGSGPGGSRPRIHDLRHTFAVRALEACPGNHKEIHRHILALSTYLGHANVADTYWYLHATPQLMVDIARASESFSQGDAR